MSALILEIDMPKGAFVTIEGSTLKYWAGQGLPDYEGSFEGFETMYPGEMAYLVKVGALKPVVS